MPRKFGFFALPLIAAISTGMLAPASAEFFGCDSSHTSSRAIYSGRSYTEHYAAQIERPRITVHPRRSHLRRNAKRYCRSWLAKEYRVSGPVIVPQMRCEWR